MFTGIIEGMGTINGIRSSGETRRMIITSELPLDGTKIGDSIAVNGACLTVVVLSGRRFEVDVSAETLARTTFGKQRSGDRVNLERALRFSDRLDGHLVSGHVDGVGVIKERETKGNVILITVAVNSVLSRYMIEKGSVAVDGISLTINRCGDDFFDLSIIPHTALMTTIRIKKIGAEVNIETDMIGQYVERFVLHKDKNKPADRKAKIEDSLTRRDFL